MADSENAPEYSVLVFDMAHTGEPDGERLVKGFRDLETARAYAEARVRSSVEELRKPDVSREQLSRLWHIYGEDCSVLGDSYRGVDRLPDYIGTPATPEQCEWVHLTPPLRRFYVALLFSDATHRSVWLMKFLRHRSRPTRDELFDLFIDDARAALEAKSPIADPVNVHIVSLFELPDPPLSDNASQRNWLVKVDFVCHDIKFGATADGVFAWPEKPAETVLDKMVAVVVSDALAMRGDGPSYLDYTDIIAVSIEETTRKPDRPES